MSDEDIHIDGRAISLSNQDKTLFPKDGISKGDLVDYYRRIAEIAIPHYRGRPLTIAPLSRRNRCGWLLPEGSARPFPRLDRTGHALDKEGGSLRQVIANDACVARLSGQSGLHHTPSRPLDDRRDRPAPYRTDHTILTRPDDDFGKGADGRTPAWRRLLDDAQIPGFVQNHRIRKACMSWCRSTEIMRHSIAVRGCADRLAAHLAKGPFRMISPPNSARRSAVTGSISNYRAQTTYGQTSRWRHYAVRPLPGAPIATPTRLGRRRWPVTCIRSATR